MKKLIFILVLFYTTSLTLYPQTGWFVQNSGTSNQLTSICFPTPTTGWIAGWYSTVLKTTNSGINWAQISMGSSLGYQCIYFVSPDVGWILGQSGTILNTTNGGNNWYSQSSGTVVTLLLAQFLSPQVGFIVGYNGTILKTVDGGSNWTAQYSGTTVNLLSEYFINSQTGFISGDYGMILKTTNGGTNWTSINSGSSNNMGKIQFVNNTTGWVSGTNGQILKTTNGGDNWFPQQSGVSSWLIDCTFIDLNTGWITGSGSMILKTMNSGNNWHQQQTNASCDFTSSFFVNQNTGWLVGTNGIILKTTNGGESLPAAPSLISPANLSIIYTTTPIMTWTSATGATNYSIQISNTNTFTNIIDSATITATNYTVPGNKLVFGNSYYWRVRGVNYLGYSSWSNIWMFTVNSNLLSPILLYPLNATIVYTNTPLLDWEDCPGAINYLVELSASSGFNTILDSATVTNSSYVVIPGILFPGTPFFWRAKARYAGGDSPWSSVWYFYVEPDGIISSGNVIPKEYKLYQNYPNPFNPSTKIKFDVAASDNISLRIYNSLGQTVEYVFKGNLSAGAYTFNWNAKNLNSGIYFIRMESGNYSFTKRMLLIK
jgi:photosystem II stability/assembly factor-like uncharacterized protein